MFTQKEHLTAWLRLRVSPTEKEKLKEDSDNAGLTISELVRRRYFGRPIVAKADKAMLRELRRIGGLLKHIHNESKGIYSKETAQTLQSVRRYMDKLANDC